MGSIFDQFFNKGKGDRKAAEIIYLNELPSSEDTLKVKAYIYGLVQGVGFRYSTVHVAKQLNINGIVENKNDGSVYVEATGERENIEQFIQELAKGPSPSANVEKVEIEYDPAITDYNGFGEAY